MKMKLIPVTLSLLVLLGPDAFAQVTPKRDIPARLKETRICGTDAYPDLTITAAEIKKSDDILVTVKSLGQCDAGPSELRMRISDVKPDSSFKGYVEFYKVPALKSGQSTQLKLWWTPGTFGTFESGRIKLNFLADARFKIKEEDEYNNEFQLQP